VSRALFTIYFVALAISLFGAILMGTPGIVLFAVVCLVGVLSVLYSVYSTK
jgi:hypothetical protein